MPSTPAAQLEPREVFSHFAALCRIPHGSGNEKGISDFLVAFARERGLSVHQDAMLNVLIKKPAAPGVDAPPVVVQNHMDMVRGKREGLDFDFEKEGIRLVVDNGWLRADGTTLGADNGIGMAYALALLDSDLPLPPIEALFTVSEEIGMDGALAFDVSLLDGSSFINIDTEEDGIFYGSCCGGMNVVLRLPLELAPAESADGGFFTLSVSGLKGGHSGAEIHKQRGNALHLLARTLDGAAQKIPYRIASLTGGMASNGIPASASAVIQLKESDRPAMEQLAAEWQAIFAIELKGSEETPELSLCPAEPAAGVMSPDCADKALSTMMLLPHGVAAMDLTMKEQSLVETSSNFAMTRQEESRLVFTVSIRSSLESKRDWIVRRLARIARMVGAEMEGMSSYPGWTFDPDSRIRKIFLRAFKNIFPGREPVVEGVHAGLECGVFARKFEQLGGKADLISFGPDIRGAHTPDERADIASVGRIWELIKEALRIIASGGEEA